MALASEPPDLGASRLPTMRPPTQANLVVLLAASLCGCSLQATQSFVTNQPGRFPRTTEIAADVRPGGPFVGAELVTEAAPEGFGARGAHLRAGYAIEPTPGSGEIWSIDLGGTAGAGKPPFSPHEVTMFENGFFSDLALRILGDGEEPGRIVLSRCNLSLVLGARARMWPAADGSVGEIAGGAGLRFMLDTDARSILHKVTREAGNAFGL